jgi:hypothetical protein
MSGALTRIVGGLSFGLLMALLLLGAGAETSHANGISGTRAERFASKLQLKKLDAIVIADALCRNKSPKKRHCRHVGRATAAAVEPGTKRKASKFTSTELSPPISPSARLPGGPRSDALHLRLSYGAVYAATRRMHI